MGVEPLCTQVGPVHKNKGFNRHQGLGIVCLSHALDKLNTSYLLQPTASVADLLFLHRFGLGRVCLGQMTKKRL